MKRDTKHKNRDSVVSNKRILNSSFKILRSKKKNQIPFPIFLFEEVSTIDLPRIKTVVFSKKSSVLFFVFTDNNFVIVPLNKTAINFFTKKQQSNIVLYNCSFEDVESQEGKVVTLHYE